MPPSPLSLHFISTSRLLLKTTLQKILSWDYHNTVNLLFMRLIQPTSLQYPQDFLAYVSFDALVLFCHDIRYITLNDHTRALILYYLSFFTEKLYPNLVDQAYRCYQNTRSHPGYFTLSRTIQRDVEQKLSSLEADEQSPAKRYKAN